MAHATTLSLALINCQEIKAKLAIGGQAFYSFALKSIGKLLGLEQDRGFAFFSFSALAR